MPVVNLDLGAVHDKLHLGPLSAGTRGLSCTGRRIARTQVTCPRRMVVISGHPSPGRRAAKAFPPGRCTDSR